ncbi:hypothetical protein [Streptomyces iranensis]|uniref:Uncharacterized protein n=1 Tax=Streptomyces iranensis TaxID=576784 RepID=A0A060ZWR4_9ACTN|nr:hypothetical protein [Streptomyces iranensis]MBP2064842.1 hypothetical protein [Streptomyces iranensis]CDR10221.1 predicted protein [Streptomyces iranensis]
MMGSQTAATARPGPAGIDPNALTYQQLQGLNCTLCGLPLGADRPLGTVTIARGATHTTYEVRGCAPSCAETSTGPAAETEWRAALEHAAGCRACQTLGGGCSEGEQLLNAYEEAARQARSGGSA